MTCPGEVLAGVAAVLVPTNTVLLTLLGAQRHRKTRAMVNDALMNGAIVWDGRDRRRDHETPEAE